MTIEKQLEILGTVNEKLIELVSQMGEKIVGMEGQILATTGILKETAIKGALQGFLIGALVTEIADGDRERLDSFMARTVGRAEMMGIGGEDAPIVLEALDELMTIVDGFAIGA